MSNNSSKRDWINSHLFIPLTSAMNRVKAAIKRHGYRGYVTRLVNYLLHSKVKSSRIGWQIQLHEIIWSWASYRQRNNRLLAHWSRETQRHQCKNKLRKKPRWIFARDTSGPSPKWYLIEAENFKNVKTVS